MFFAFRRAALERRLSSPAQLHAPVDRERTRRAEKSKRKMSTGKEMLFRPRSAIERAIKNAFFDEYACDRRFLRARFNHSDGERDAMPLPGDYVVRPMHEKYISRYGFSCTSLKSIGIVRREAGAPRASLDAFIFGMCADFVSNSVHLHSIRLRRSKAQRDR